MVYGWVGWCVVPVYSEGVVGIVEKVCEGSAAVGERQHCRLAHQSAVKTG